MERRAGVWLLGVALASLGCRGKAAGDTGAAASMGSAAAPVSPAPSAEVSAASASAVDGLCGAEPDGGPSCADAGAQAALPGTSEGCPTDMLLVAGKYCPDVRQDCLEHHREFASDEAKKKEKRERGESVSPSTVSERCLRYREPSECLSAERRPMRYCMDRYEWPNKKGELPALLVTWGDAAKACEAVGKRLCSEDEFNFACEGEAMLPYTYGYVRDPGKCSIDKPYRKREHKLLKYEACMANPACKAELERLDQRLPVGSLPACISPFGVYDLNGNINEWVVRPNQKAPNRSGLKGGWWGPVRGRCRPTVGFHKEGDYGYEEGFRCCKDAEAAKAP